LTKTIFSLLLFNVLEKGNALKMDVFAINIGEELIAVSTKELNAMEI
jgi:hypothetical protein